MDLENGLDRLLRSRTAFLVLTLLLIALIALLCLTGNAKEKEAARTPQEERLVRILSGIRGAGRVEVMIACEPGDGERAAGAVVVSEGAEDIAVRMELLRAASAALHVKEEQVDVFIMGKDDGIEGNETDEY